MPVFHAIGLPPPFSLIGLSFNAGQSMEGVLKWEAVVRRMEAVLPLLRNIAALLVYYWIAVLLPMSVVRRMRPLIAAALRISSLLIGGVCWWHSFIVVYRLLGSFDVIVGILCGGVGVVPMALFAAASRGNRVVFWNLLATLALALIPRIAAGSMMNREARRRDAIVVSSYFVDQ